MSSALCFFHIFEVSSFVFHRVRRQPKLKIQRYLLLFFCWFYLYAVTASLYEILTLFPSVVVLFFQCHRCFWGKGRGGDVRGAWLKLLHFIILRVKHSLVIRSRKP